MSTDPGSGPSERAARVEHVDPFATPPAERDAVRRLRGRLALPVTVWTAGAGHGRAGLTVASVLVAQGEPSSLLGLVDGDSDLWDAVVDTGVFVVHLLGRDDTALADVFAGVRPAPGGRFRDRAVEDSAYGPVLTELATRVSCRLRASRPMGWATFVEATVEHLAVGPVGDPLVWHHGRYRGLAG